MVSRDSNAMKLSHSMERRKHTRYNLRLPVLVSWYNEHRERIDDGWTTDVSTHGVNILCNPEYCPPAGKRLTITLPMPTCEATRPRVVLKGQGKVLRRANTSDKWTSFAAETFFKV